MFAEMAGLAAHDTTIDSAEILRRATVNGARALGLELEVGSLQPGLLADLCVIAARAADDDVHDAIVHHEGLASATWIGGVPTWTRPDHAELSAA
jgi:cytosine/adenosine deaminase-related metal-dependent hydrolase